jgi:hypothetical protein
MKQNVRCTIIEEIAIAAAASGIVSVEVSSLQHNTKLTRTCELYCYVTTGKAGGFLAKNWGDDTTSPLHHQSYALHAQLSEELNLESYRQIPTMQVSRGTRSNKRKLETEMAVSWIDKTGVAEVMDAFDTAQVCPLELTTKLMEAVVAFGSTLIFGRVCGICVDRRGREGGGGGGCVSGVRYTAAGGQSGEVLLAADKVVIATGPWAGVHAQDWLGVHVPMQVAAAAALLLSLASLLFCAVYVSVIEWLYLCGRASSQHQWFTRTLLVLFSKSHTRYSVMKTTTDATSRYIRAVMGRCTCVVVEAPIFWVSV